ncbi:TlpA family protein disulfide reductase [Carboxylicivirga taeanensis]|uniref:TlpA family protein disulfide reductase n=1 Tax=Carboxylicivirga taeanensis TaxID=1416875 RepID=UPI003F6DB587
MKTLTITIALLIISLLTNAQEEYKKNAIANAELLIKAVNNDDFKTYADYLTEEQYPFEDKTGLYSMWEKMLTRDTREFSNIKLIRFGIFNNTQQAYYTFNIGDKEAGLLGVSKDNGDTWHFTQPIGIFNYTQIKERQMPQLDISFAELDTNYNKRIAFEVGQEISSFDFVDINGISLNSDELKGKTIVLNFWSTGCAPCIKEMPELNEIVNKANNKEVVFIALTYHASKEQLQTQFLPKHPFLYHIVTVNADDYQVTALPTHIIVDNNLKVTHKIVGYSEENLNKLESILNTI